MDLHPTARPKPPTLGLALIGRDPSDTKHKYAQAIWEIEEIKQTPELF